MTIHMQVTQMTPAQLANHYREVRKRLYGKPKKPSLSIRPELPLSKPPEKEPFTTLPTETATQKQIGNHLKWQQEQAEKLKQELSENQNFVPLKSKHDEIKAQVKDMIAEVQMTWEEVFSESREQRYMGIRRRIWAWLRLCGMSTSQIGKFCRPNKPYDHTTVHHGLKKFNQLPQDLPPPIPYGTLHAHHGPKPVETLIQERQKHEANNHPYSGGSSLRHDSN